MASAVEQARLILDRNPITTYPYGVFVDGEIVHIGADKPGTLLSARHYRQNIYPRRKVTVRKRRLTDIILGEQS